MAGGRLAVPLLSLGLALASAACTTGRLVENYEVLSVPVAGTHYEPGRGWNTAIGSPRRTRAPSRARSAVSRAPRRAVSVTSSAALIRAGITTRAPGAPAPKVERVEVPALTDKQIDRIYRASEEMDRLGKNQRAVGDSWVAAAADLLSGSRDDPHWRWAAPRLTYANAVIPDAALAVATATGSEDDLAAALWMLEWLVAEESHGGRFSFTPVGGRGPGDPRPAFDQQPIEASAMADACARAFSATGDIRWAQSAAQAARWFLGDNDTGATMFDPATGGGFDGLQSHGVNENQGAESTLAFVGTMAQVHRLRHVAATKGRDRDGRRTA